jgi:hypothetical protein
LQPTKDTQTLSPPSGRPSNSTHTRLLCLVASLHLQHQWLSADCLSPILPDYSFEHATQLIRIFQLFGLFFRKLFFRLPRFALPSPSPVKELLLYLPMSILEQAADSLHFSLLGSSAAFVRYPTRSHHHFATSVSKPPLPFGRHSTLVPLYSRSKAHSRVDRIYLKFVFKSLGNESTNRSLPFLFVVPPSLNRRFIDSCAVILFSSPHSTCHALVSDSNSFFSFFLLVLVNISIRTI